MEPGSSRRHGTYPTSCIRVSSLESQNIATDRREGVSLFIILVCYRWNSLEDELLREPWGWLRSLFSCKIISQYSTDYSCSTTAIGKQWSPPEVQAILGHYSELGPQAAAMIPGSTLITFPDLGHSPQISAPERFHKELLGWLLVG